MLQATLHHSVVSANKFADSIPADEAVLIPLYEAYRAASDALLGIYNKPRVSGSAADIIEDEMERMDSLACAVAEKLKELTSVKNFWREAYAKTLLSHDFYIGAGMEDVLRTAAAVNALPVIECSAETEG